MPAVNQVIAKNGDIPSKLDHLNIAISLFLQVSLVSAFLGFFYFTYVDKIEREIVIEQVTDVVNDFTGNNLLLLNSEVVSALRTKFNALTPPDMSAQDTATSYKNSFLEREAFMILFTIALSGIIFFIGHSIFVYKAGFSREAGYVLLEAIIMLGAIALTEYCFLTFITRKFMTADPNVIRAAIITKLIQFKEHNTRAT
jgi:hypothetical protein